MVLTELILNSFYIWARVAGLESSDFSQFLYWAGCGGLETTDCSQFLYWEGVVVWQELLFISFYFGRVWWS